MKGRGFRIMGMALAAVLAAIFAVSDAQAAFSCTNTVTAKVVILDTPILFNRLGAQNVNWMTYALRRDVVAGLEGTGTPLTQDGSAIPGKVSVRADKRIRPLVLRVNEGDCLEIQFQNLLAEPANPFNAVVLNPDGTPADPQPVPNPLQINDQVTGRYAGFHVQGLNLVGNIASDASNVGAQGVVGAGVSPKNGLVKPSDSFTYTYYAPPGSRGTYLAHSYGATFGGEASAGNVGVGAFAAVNVEPKDAKWYRSQVTEEEMRLATDLTKGCVLGTETGCNLVVNPGHTPDGHPILNYEALYPNSPPWSTEGKGGRPILNMLDGNEIVHSDLNAIIAYKNSGTGNFENFPAITYPLESVGKRNPTVPNRLEPFREFTVIFHDENAVAQAFPAFFNHPVLRHTLHGVRDSFLINYGSGGIGAEIIANRLGVGPMHDCLTCSYEEFFLTSFTVGDPAMLVDVPANAGLELCGPDGGSACAAVGPKAEFALYPDDPSNVHHSYVNDRVVFRNLHAGKEQHVFHLHNHQWLFDANDDNSNYLDAEGIGPGSGYTYEINFGGSGNRNKSAGDAIFHCHFYPHFAQGMWEHWRHHDVFEAGTRLDVTGSATADVYHATPFALTDGTPAVHPNAGTTLPNGARMRALPDGEILVGTPIPALVPLPGKPMAVMPGEVVIVAKNADGIGGPDSSQAHVVDRTKNPGYPFWIAGIDCGGNPVTCPQGIVGQRPTTPPLDMQVGSTPVDGGWDGGLPRHSLDGFLAVGGRIDNGPDPDAGGVFHQVQSRLSFEKEIFKAKAVWFPEEGTDLEQVAMVFHGPQAGGPYHDTYLPDGTAATGPDGFRVNGAPSVPGAPFFEPCIDDKGKHLTTANGAGEFFDGNPGGFGVTGSSQFTADNPRLYKGAAVQIDAIFNKVGYHYPQQRITALWEDVFDTINKVKAPQPFVIRNNTFDCTDFLHTNLVPKFFEMDDYQVKTPTDIIGQHIHLPKWDLPSADGSGNGWNYEDGTLSPGMVQERIHAINTFNPSGTGNPQDSAGRPANTSLVARPHPFFGSGEPIPDGHGGFINEYDGARTTIQRWFFDPVVNVAGVDRGLGIIFTHDHYGPSTHQQVGLYASVVAEPAGSVWVHNETGELMYTRDDGGPMSWQAIIRPGTETQNGPTVASFEPFREFWFQYGDFQHAYEAGVYVGADDFGRPTGVVPTPTTFVNAINPSFRQFAGFPDIMKFPATCPGGVPRPCPEAISADDVGMLVVNYRNEPVGLRVFDPNRQNCTDDPTPNNGTVDKGGCQAVAEVTDTNLNGILDTDPKRGDLAFALQTRTDRAIAALNTQPAFYTEDLNAAGAHLPGDPFTPLMRVHPGDLVRVKTQAGSTEHEHNWAIHGFKWLQGGSGHGEAKNTGWRNAQNGGISEQFTFRAPVITAPRQITGHNDHAYTADASQDGWWTGIWGILRAYQGGQPNLQVIGFDRAPRIVNVNEFIGVCPIDPNSPRNNPRPLKPRPYTVIAMLANELLCTRNNARNCVGNPLGVTIPPNTGRDSDGDGTGDNEGAPLNTLGGTLVYNPRLTNLTNGKSGPLHDPTAILYVLADDLESLPGQGGNVCQNNQARPGVANPACRVKLKAGVTPEPLVLRAAADDCVEVTLFNRLPAVVPDLAGVNTLLQMVNRDRDPVNGLTTFQNNLVRPSSHIGLHTQLLAYDVSQHDGACVGINTCGNGINTVGPVVGGVLDKAVTYRWYAGDIAFQPEGNGVRLVATPVEFGGVNLQPADKIKQGQKALVGALAVHPQGFAWTNDPGTRAAASVGPDVSPKDGAPDTVAFKDFAVVIQKGLNHRYKDGTYVANIASEGQGIPEDSHDSGQMGINYGTEPMWYRFGIRPDAPFGHTGVPANPGFADVPNPEDAYSNLLTLQRNGTGGPVGNPVTPVFTAKKNQEIRMHILEPTGVGRGTTFHLHGQLWQRAPYVCPGSSDLGLTGKCMANEVGSRAIGLNPIGMYLGAQESVTPSAHFDIRLPKAGGEGEVTGDYLYRDQASFGNTGGLWGILRVGQ